MDPRPTVELDYPNWLTRLFSLHRLLTPARRRYPWFIGAALWGAWLLSLVLGQLQTNTGPTDRFGQLFGTDFVAFYTAGRIVGNGQSADLYDLTLAHQIQQEIYQVGSENFNPYLNPPFYAILFIPFSRLPYPTAAGIWMALNLAFLWMSIWLLDPQHYQRKAWLALTWLPAWSAITFGQNAFLSMLILSTVYALWRRERDFLAGLVGGLMLYKPQLAIGLGLLWLFDARRSWKSLAGMAASGLGLATFSVLAMPEASKAYVNYALEINRNLMIFTGFPIWNAHGVQTFFFGILPGMKTVGQVLYGICAATGVVVYLRFFQKYTSAALRFSGAVCLTLWATPYVMIYDWSLLLVPAILLWKALPEHRPALEVLFSILWVVMFFSTPLTAAQLRLFGAAVQISVPALALVLAAVVRMLSYSPDSPGPNAEPR